MFNLLILSFLFPSFLYLLKLARGTRLNLPPSPPKLPIIGNLHQLGELPHRSFRALSEKYGPLVFFHFGSAPVLVVSSPDIAAEIMKSNDLIFGSRPRIRAADIIFYGCSDIAFCPYGDYWRQAKKVCVLELLSAKRVQAFHFVRQEEVAEMVHKIQHSCPDGTPINLTKMFVTISNNIVSRAALGRKYSREDGNVNFGLLSRRTMDLIGAFSFGDYIPYLRVMDILTGLDARLRKTCNELHSLLNQVIEEHQQSNNSQSDKKDLVDILLSLQKDEMLNLNLTRENLIAILTDMFVGGTDTTAVTMEWAVAELVRNPHTMKKTQKEVRRIVGKKARIDESDLNQMDYLKCVIKETLRLHAPTIVTRESSATTKVGGYEIPPKTRVLINSWAIQRDPKLWDRPEEFLPERFYEKPVDFKGNHSEFIPFGMGRRVCPGISFAVTEAEYVLANLLYWFDSRLPPGETVEDLDMGEAFGLVIRKKLPLHLVPVLPSF